VQKKCFLTIKHNNKFNLTSCCQPQNKLNVWQEFHLQTTRFEPRTSCGSRSPEEAYMSLNFKSLFGLKQKKKTRSKLRQTNTTLSQMGGGGWPGVDTQAKKSQEPKKKAKNPEKEEWAKIKS